MKTKKTKKAQKGKYVNGGMFQDCIIEQKISVIDEIAKLMKNEDISGAMSLIAEQENIMGTYHIYYPDYTIAFKNIGGTKVPFSKPLTKNAIEKIPPSIKGKFKIPQKYLGFKSMEELLSYSYRTQTDIEINIVELTKMLGKFEDPYQQEITTLLDALDSKFFIRHKKFPEAKPYKIVINDSEEYLDYILLRVIKITDNSEIIMSNFEQQSYIKIELSIDDFNKKVDFKVDFNKDKDADNYKSNLVKYLKFMSQLKSGNELSIISLEEGIVIASGIQGNINYTSEFASIENEILFLEYILLIEEKYGRTINIPATITDDDLEYISYLAEGIRDRTVTRYWNNCEYSLILTEDIINTLKKYDNTPIELLCESKKDFIIFGERFEVNKIREIFKGAIIQNIKKLQQKLKVLEVGDPIKINLKSSYNNNVYEGVFYFI